MKTSFWDGKLQEDKLGGYVYALVDPRRNRNNIFYVGLAGGKEGKGNNRPDAHLVETAEKIKQKATLTAKQERIKQIWDEHEEPELIIVRRNLTPEMAKHVEAALIDLLGHAQSTGKLTNEVRGHWVNEHSIVTEQNRAELLAEPVSPNSEIHNVWLFSIANALKAGKTPYDATRGNWEIADKKQLNNAGYAVGLENGIARIVIKINKWTDYDNKLKCFQGDVINNSELGKQLFEKDFSSIIEKVGYWQRGKPLLINFIRPNKALDKMVVEYVRGYKGEPRDL